MAGRISKGWRILRTGTAFVYYGVGGLALAGLILPLHRRWIGASEHAELGAQRVIQRGSRSFVRFMELLGLLRVQWTGTERLAHGPLLVVANHPSLIDTPLLTCCMPQVDFVVSAEWSRNPFMRRGVEAAGYLRADRGAAVIDEAVARLRAGRSVLIYPEGTRSPLGALGRFYRGAAHIALASGFPLTPVTITCEPRVLMKGQKWYEVPDRRPQYSVQVGEPISPPKALGGPPSRLLAARKLTAILREYYEKRVSRAQP